MNANAALYLLNGSTGNCLAKFTILAEKVVLCLCLQLISTGPKVTKKLVNQLNQLNQVLRFPSSERMLAGS